MRTSPLSFRLWRGVFAAAVLLLATEASAQAFPTEVQVVLDGAVTAGLPVDALEQKAREGLAKGVSPEQTAAVLKARVADLDRARLALGPTADGATLTSAAAAIRAGGAPDAIRLLARLPADIRTRALEGFADLLELGVSEPDALGLVEGVATGPEAVAGVDALVRTMASLVASGMSQRAAVEAVVGAVHPGGSNASGHRGNENAPYGPGGRAGNDPPEQSNRPDTPPGQENRP